MKKPKNRHQKRKDKWKAKWTLEWVTYIPGKGHCLTQYIAGRAIWLAGEYVGK